MKKTVVFIAVLLVGFSLSGQTLTYEIGESISSFDYKNSEGNSIDLQSSAKTYLGVGYKHPIRDYFGFVSSLNYNHYGATGHLKIINSDYFLQWDLHFIAANLGANFSWTKDLFTLYSEVGGSYELLIRGNQYTNEVPVNLRRKEEFNNQFVYYRVGVGASYEMTRTVSLFLQYTFARSLPLKDRTASSQERLAINAHKIGLGIQIKMRFDRW